MAGAPLLGLTLLTYTASGPAATGFPLTNLSDTVHALREWRSTATTLTELVLDMATATIVAAVMLNAVNFATAEIRGNATDSWGAPSFGPVTISPVNDPQMVRQKAWLALTAFNYRYLKLSITAQTPTDAAAFFRIGTLVLMSPVTTLAQELEAPFEREIFHAERSVEFLDGGEEVSDLGMQGLQLTISSRFHKESGILPQLWAIKDKGQSGAFVFNENDDDASHVYLVRRKGGFIVTDDQWPLLSIRGLILREVT